MAVSVEHPCRQRISANSAPGVVFARAASSAKAATTVFLSEAKLMKKPPVCLLTPTRATDAHQELAIAVIRQAVIDATNPVAETRVRAGARAFLNGSPMLREWCGVAGIDPRLVLERCVGEDR
jgi:hypothetical protein